MKALPTLRRIAASMAVICLLALPAASGTIEQGPEADGFFQQVEFQIGYQFSYMKYDESVMTEDGFMNGVFATLVFHHADWMMRLQGDYSAGTLDYDGETWGGTPISTSGDDYVYHLRMTVGYDLFPSPNLAVTPYIGLAQRFWEDKQSGSGSYKRQTTYMYSPIGVELNYKDDGPWSYGGQVEYAYFWYGENVSTFSDVDPGFNDPQFDQDNGWGMSLSAYVNYDFGGWGICFQPFFEYWDIDDSGMKELTYYGVPTGYVVYEPSNNTSVYGLRITADF